MNLSVFDIFKIGVGPSSSHTMGPMSAALHVRRRPGATAACSRRRARSARRLYGSLALTGKGHCTDRAMLLGLEGHRPRHGRSGGDRADARAHPRAAAACACGAARDRVRRAARPAVSPRPDAAAAPERHALHGARRRGRGAASRRVLLDRRRLRRARGRVGRERRREQGSRVPLSASSPAPTCSRSAGEQRPRDARARARERGARGDRRRRSRAGCCASGRR